MAIALPFLHSQQTAVALVAAVVAALTTEPWHCWLSLACATMTAVAVLTRQRQWGRA
jgi:hypothetical protein